MTVVHFYICVSTGPSPPPSSWSSSARWWAACSAGVPCRPGPGSRPVPGVYRGARRHREQLRRRGRIGPARLRCHHRHAPDAGPPFELHGPPELRADARAAGGAVLRPRHFDSASSMATSPSSVVFEDSPAYAGGLRRGDVIAKIEGEDTKGWTSDQAVAKLRGPRGTPVNISIRRAGYDKLIDLRVQRDEMHIPTVTGGVHDRRHDRVRQARRAGFGENTDQELGRALRDLTQQGMKRLVFDLRENPGGALDQAIKVSNRFLPRGDMIVYTRGRADELGSGLPRHRAERLPEPADGHAGESQQRQRLGNRLRRAAGSRPLAHRRRDDVRQGAGAVGVPRQRQATPAPRSPPRATTRRAAD